jgi:hypothetical protein
MPMPPWVIVYTGNATDTAMLYSLLEAEEIPARVGDELVGTLAPYAAGGEKAAGAVKVLVPEDRIDDAEEVVSEFVEDMRSQSSPSAASSPWTCPCCHEKNDGTFDICWNCQTEKSQEDCG